MIEEVNYLNEALVSKQRSQDAALTCKWRADAEAVNVDDCSSAENTVGLRS